MIKKQNLVHSVVTMLSNTLNKHIVNGIEDHVNISGNDQIVLFYQGVEYTIKVEKNS